MSFITITHDQAYGILRAERGFDRKPDYTIKGAFEALRDLMRGIYCEPCITLRDDRTIWYAEIGDCYTITL